MPKSAFEEEIGNQERRKLLAETKKLSTVWLGIGMFGLIGWSVAMPALVGALIGEWLDRRYPSNHSYTLALLVAGLTLGCWNAWRWIAKEQQAMDEQRDGK